MRQPYKEMWEVNKYLWICLAFIALFIPIAAAHGMLTVPLPVAYGVFALAVVNGGIRTYCAYRRGGYNDGRGWIFTIVDAALISLAIRISGGIRSELWLIYYVLLVSETLFVQTAEALLLIAFMALGYLIATYPARLEPDYWVTASTRIFFLFVVGAFGRRLSGDRERRGKELAHLQEQVAASEERARIAREVHDSLGHALVASILRLELCLRLMRKAPDEAEKLLQEEVPALRTAWNEGRNLAFHLRPWERDPAGFAHSLRRHLSRFAERTGIAVDLAMPDEQWDLSPETELALLRIAQEALTNIAKHAEASRVCIRLDRRGGAIHCVIQDDGRGFDADACAGSFGLNAMRERAEERGGRFHLLTHPDAGTTIEASVPAR